MVQQKLRKVGNSYVVTIPRAEVERLQLKEGELVGIEVHALDVQPRLADDLREAIVRTWKEDEPAYRYLGGEPSST
jgi:antitoxin component of MazEF toxin-antitoxin module